MITPKILVRCLAAYNGGSLHGAWIDCDQDHEDIYAEIKEMLRASPETDQKCPECEYEGEPDEDDECPECGMHMHVAEEWAIHDYEDFCGIEISEHEDIELVSELGLLISEMDDQRASAFAHWFGNDDHDIKRLKEDFEESYLGSYSYLEDWAEQYLEDTGSLGDMPEQLRYYFDYEKYARDCVLGGDIWVAEDEHGVHVFNNV